MIIIANKPGYLANRLIIFSNFIAYALEYDQKILNPAFGDFAKYFQGTQKSSIPRFPQKNGFKTSSILNKPSYGFFNICARTVRRLGLKSKIVSSTSLQWDETFSLDSEFKPARVHFIEGWKYRNTFLMQKHKESIKSFFSLASAYDEKLKTYMAKYKSTEITLVGVHVRHGDYETFESGRFFYEVETYLDIMRKVRDLLPDKQVRFIVSTNNTQLSKDDFKDLNVEMGPGHFVLDLYTLSHCDYILGPPSTFSAWASYFGNTPLYFIKDPKAIMTIEEFKEWH